MKDENPARLTSEEELRVRELFKEVPFAHLLGLELEEVERGAATLSLFARDDLRQVNGLTHGGVTASLIDTASAFAVMSLLEPGQTTTTVDLTIHYLRPWLKGQARAHARVRRAGRRVAFVSIDVVDESEMLVATALTTYLILT